MTADDLLRPGFIANTGFTAAYPILDQIGELTGPVKFFHNIVLIGALALAWVITMFAFFFLAIQLFVTILEFKLTTLAGKGSWKCCGQRHQAHGSCDYHWHWIDNFW